MTYNEDEKKRAEETKLAHDYFKHIATLSTGSILLIATFLEKLFTQPEWKCMVGIAIISFLLSVISSIAAQTIAIDTMHKEPEGKLKPLFALSMLFAWVGFLAGILALGVFSLKNLF